MSTSKVTAEQVRAAIKARYPAPEYAVLFEVIDATGARHTRSADAVVMSCWPSRGLELHGMEIKVSRADWRHEREQPEKAEKIAAYCDRWWLVTAPGVVADISEVPPAWGWAEFVAERDDLALRRQPVGLVTRREPQRTEAQACDRAFLASLLRNAAKVSDGLVAKAREEVRESVEAVIEERVAERLRWRREKGNDLAAAVEAFQAETGIELMKEETWGYLRVDEGREIGRMVTALRASGLHRAWGGLEGFIRAARDVASQAEKLCAQMGVEAPKAEMKPRRGKAAA